MNTASAKVVTYGITVRGGVRAEEEWRGGERRAGGKKGKKNERTPKTQSLRSLLKDRNFF